MYEKSFLKFPSTPYLVAPKAPISRQDKILSEKDAEVFFLKNVTVEEKIDGANLGISFTSNGLIQLQNRGNIILEPYSGQWAILSKWLKYNTDRLFDILLDKYILFGEWCYFSHSIIYNALPNWFIAFDVFDKTNNIFLPVTKRNHIVNQIGLPLVPLIYYGHIEKDMLYNFITKSAFGNDLIEGLYFRVDSPNQLLYRAKYVRNDFSQAIKTHWSKMHTQKNQLKYCSTE